MEKNDDLKLSAMNMQHLQELEDRMKEIKERTTEFVQKYPLTSVLIAASAGYLLARIFSGRRS